MFRRTMLALLFCFPLSALAEEASTPPIEELTDVRPNDKAFEVKRDKLPIVVRSADEAKQFFTGENLAAMKEKVDFRSQVVLVFAWQGSGQDKLSYDVLESFPEQLVFTIKPGRTRDLRSHSHVFVVRSNVKWKLK
jgi:hypothetical protein